MLLIKNGYVIDPASGLEGNYDILVDRGKIKQIAKRIKIKDIDVLDVKGLVVVPGLVDMHVHLREPGNEDAETIRTGSAAAACGGFTSILAMPNTNPPIDNAGMVQFVRSTARREAVVNVYVAGCITKGRAGKELAEIGDIVGAGACAISDDGNSVANSEILRRAMEYSKMFGIPVIEHCQEPNLGEGGVVHEGFVSTVLGLPAIPAESEEIIVARDIALARLTGAHLHICHVSTKGAVSMIREAKREGLHITCDVTPHHLLLTDEAVMSFDPNTKVNPPLRDEEHRQALLEGLADGTIDAIATDHAPHPEYAKELEFSLAPFGIVGLETALSLILSEIVGKGYLSLKDAIAKMSANPANILSLKGKGKIQEGADADLTIIDMDYEYEVDPNKFASKSRNTPFAGWKLKGRAVGTVVAGKLIMDHGRIRVD